MPYKAIFLDLDGTIFDFKASEHAGFLHAMRENGIAATDEMYARYTVINQRMWQLLEQGDITLPELKTERFRLTLASFGLLADADRLNEQYVNFLSQSVFLMDGARDFVQKLSLHFLICMVTNGIHNNQVGRLRLSGLLPFTHTMVTSEEAGAPKPDPAVFEEALRRCPGLSKKDCLLIGDSESADILGAQNFGIDAIWFNPQKKAARLNTHPLLEASSYSEIEWFLQV